MAETKRSRRSDKFERYGLWWGYHYTDAMVERDMVRNGGTFTRPDGAILGEGLLSHFIKFQKLLWPEKAWHRWNELETKAWLEHTYIGEMGCAGAGKSDTAAANLLADWYCFAECTTGLVSSTDLKSLELRIWGMIKRYHRSAKERFSWIPGHLIEGKQMLVLDDKTAASEGRDFRNGIVAVACKRGNQYVGLGSYVGIHNKRVRLVADECNLMPRAFIDSTANLSKCQDFKLLGLGNPNETTNAHGFLCEPATDLGGWEGGIDQQPGTKTWPTRFPNGLAIQLPGSDCPNMDAPEDEPPPFPFLITRKQMREDADIWGTDDWHYTMMNEARMPRGQGSRRVLTRQMCTKFHAFDAPEWRDTNKTSIAFLDAAYRGVGGDRCVFGELQFGAEAAALDADFEPAPFVVQSVPRPELRQIIALIDLAIIPVSSERGADAPEDQIVRYVMDQCERRGIAASHFYFDAGMRTSLVTAFSRLWSTAINSVDCGGKPSETRVSEEISRTCREYYSKFITELWYSVRLAVESGQFRGLTEEVVYEFAAREWKMVSGNRIEVESKDEMKVKTGRSPDLADAVAIGVFGARERGFHITRMARTGPRRREDLRWRRDVEERARKLWNSRALTHKA